MGDRLAARGAQEVEPVALGFGEGLLVGQDVLVLRSGFGQPQGTDHPSGGAPARIGHAVGVQARFGVGHEDPLGLPSGEQVGRHHVAVSSGGQVGFGQLDQHRVGMVARGQATALGG